MKPSSIPNITNGEFFVDAKLFRGLHEDEECPEGTIPIIRHAREDENSVHGAIHAVERQKKLNISVDYATNIAHEVNHTIKLNDCTLFSHACIIMSNELIKIP
jgi:hypothetical protein